MDDSAKLDRIIELLEKLVAKREKNSSKRVFVPPAKKCTCTGMRVGGLHMYGCPFHRRLTLRG